MSTTNTTTISGRIHNVVFYNEETMYAVARLETSKNQLQTIVGVMPALQAGETVHCVGKWEVHSEHGRQFTVESFRFELPKDVDAIVKFLGTQFAAGIGPTSAQKIVDHFGPKIFDVLNSNPEELYNVHGLSKKRADSLIQAWKLHTTFQEVLLKLLSFGVSRTYAIKIIRKWGHETLQTIEKNPYLLAKEIKGIGFLLADAIAKKVGFPHDSLERLESGAEFLLWELVQEGHTCFPLDAFTQLGIERLQVSKELIENAIEALLQKKQVVLKESFIATKAMALAEETIADHVRRIAGAPSLIRKIDIDKAIPWASKTLHLQFSEEQKEAIKTALASPLSIITGGPGTGKSTITKAILAILTLITPKVLLAAPTGRAAKRLSEITRKHASTIHRLLKFDPSAGKFQYNPDNPLPCTTLIVDEVSMLDTPLAAHLLRAIPSGCKVILIGDAHQLPSVGPGTVLKDLIQSETIPSTQLKTIFRQASFSTIIRAAHRINQGEMPPFKNFPKTDYFFIEKEEPEDVVSSIVELVSKKIPDEFGYDPRTDIQVLIPMRKGRCGIDAINLELQKVFSGTGRRFHVGDKVIQLKNNYSKGVFNGDVGVVSSIDQETGLMKVQMDETPVEYDENDRDELSLAWSISVHKYQGSEAPCAIIVCHTQHFKLLTRNLLYTAVTRGKKHVFVIGTKRAVAIAVNTQDANVRHTGLMRKLTESLAL